MLPTLLASPSHSTFDLHSPKSWLSVKAWSAAKHPTSRFAETRCTSQVRSLLNLKHSSKPLDGGVAFEDHLPVISSVQQTQHAGVQSQSKTSLPPPVPPSSPRSRSHRHRHGKKERSGKKEHKAKEFASSGVLCRTGGSLAAVASSILYGFLVGDKVTTAGGPDAAGPWREMGNGKVVGRSAQKGFLIVKFTEGVRSEEFAIRAKNLMKASESPVSEPNSDLQQYGLSVGDAVIWHRDGPASDVHNQSRGIVTDSGPSSGIALVKFGGVGVRSVRIDQLAKVVFHDEVENVLSSGIQSSLFTPGQRRLSMDEQRAKDLAASAWASFDRLGKKSVQFDCLNGLKVGCFVQAKVSPWNGLGVGILQNPGKEPGTARVQFNILGELWDLRCEDLEQVDDPGCCMFQDRVRCDFACKHPS